MRVLNLRYLSFFCLFFMAGIFTAYIFGMEIWDFFWLCLAAGAAALLYIILKKKFLIPILLFFLCLGNFLCMNQLNTDFAGIRQGTDYTVTGRVCDYPDKSSEYARYTLADVTLTDGPNTIDFAKRVQLVTSDKSFAYGDIITFSSRVYPPDGETMPGSFNNRLYLASRYIGFSAFGSDAIKTGYRWMPYELFVHARETLESNIDKTHSQETAPIAKAMFLGIQNEIPDEVYGSFSQTGIVHILSISGLHIGVIALILNLLLKKTRIRRDWRFILNIALLLLYTSITGFPVSVVRASLMTILLLTARWRFMDRDTLIFLSGAMLLTLIFNPVQLFMPGFLLSYGTVFGILCIYPPLRKAVQNKKSEKINGTADLFCVSTAATSASFPLTAYYFNNVALISPLANFYAVPVSSLILIFAGLSALSSCVWEGLGKIFSYFSESAIKFLIIVNNFVSGAEWGNIRTYNFPVWAGISVFAVLFIISDYFMVKIKTKAVAVLLICGFIFLPFISAASSDDSIKITFLDAGNGEAVHIAYNRENILISNATESAAYNVNSYSKRNGFEYDAFILTESNPSHYGGALSIIQNGIVAGEFISHESSDGIAEACRDKGILMRGAQKYDTLWNDGGLRITVQQDTYNALTLLVSYMGENLCLLSGHSAKRSKDLSVSARVLRVASEGGASSLNKSFLETVQPEYAVISVSGTNGYGLPDEGTIDILHSEGVTVYRTDRNYTITMTIDKTGNITMRPMHED